MRKLIKARDRQDQGEIKSKTMCYIQSSNWFVKVRYLRHVKGKDIKIFRIKKKLSKSSRHLAYLTLNTWVLPDVNETSR